jgi:hypothetical protein
MVKKIKNDIHYLNQYKSLSKKSIMTSLPVDFIKMSKQELEQFIVEHPEVDLNAKLPIHYLDYITPIQLAVRKAKTELVRVLLSNNVDTKDILSHFLITEKTDFFYLENNMFRFSNLSDTYMMKDLLKSIDPEEWDRFMSKEACEKRQKDATEAFWEKYDELKKQGAVKCTRCYSLFFPDRKEQPIPLWKLKNNPNFRESWFDWRGGQPYFDDSFLDHDTVCLGHSGNVSCRLGGTMSGPGCCQWTCCGIGKNNPGCVQYKEHTIM